MSFLRGRRYVLSGLAGAGLLALGGCDLGAAPTTYPAPGGVAGVGDVDGDGDLDIVTSGNDDEFGVLLGDGTGGFTATTVPHVTNCDLGDPTWICSEVRVTQVTDVDNDGLDDVAVQSNVRSNDPPPSENFSHESLNVRLADGSGGFADPLGTPGQASLQDVTGDGNVDLVSTDTIGDPQPLRLRVWPGDGTGAFGQPVLSDMPAGHAIATVAAADVDEDGVPDLVLDGTCIQDGGELLLRACVDVLPGDGTGAFPTSAARLTAADPEADGIGTALGDVDEDGDLDIVGGNTGTDFDGGGPVATLSVFRGDGAGGFGPEEVRPAGAQTADVQLADLDADGHLDLLNDTDDRDLDYTDDFGRILFGDGDGRFSGPHLLPTGDGAIADLDADGRPDFVATTAEGTQVFLNRWATRPG